MSAAASPGAVRLAAVEQAEPRGSRAGLLLTVCCLAQFMVILDVSIVNVALPSIHRSLGFSESQLQWVVNAYTIPFAGFLMLSGRAADRFGGRLTFIVGVLLFSLASLAGGTAGARGVLVGARALQGLGGAVMAAASLAIITHSFAAGPQRHRAIGLWGAMNGAGGAAGTLLGGIITQELSWRWVLLINLPIGIAVAAVARAVIAEHRDGRATAGSFDLAGALTVTIGLLALVFGIVDADSHGWGAAATLGPIAAGLVLLALFVRVEGRYAKAPLVPLRVFSNHLLRTANLVVLALSAALFPMWYLATLYLQEVLHFGALDAGLAFLPMALTIMAGASQAGLLVARFGAGRVLAAGLALFAAGLALFARVNADGGYVTDFLLPGVLASAGIGLAVVSSTIAATATAEPGEAGLVSGLVNTARQMGGALGIAVLSTVAVEYSRHLVNSDYTAGIVALNDGFRLAFAIAAAFALAAAAIAFRFIPASLAPPRPVQPVAPSAGARGGEPAAGVQAAVARNAERGPAAPAVEPAGGAVEAAGQAVPAVPAVEPAPTPPGPPRHGSLQAFPPRRAPAEPAGEQAPQTVPARAGRRTATSIAFTRPDGGSWPPARGSSTVRLAADTSSPPA
jgi:EmrB/QacA subfamily drug resistance transporter